jgi:putative ATP-dependent endonuclease of OLD family
MKLKTIEIKNFRNLNETKLVFDPMINFIVGEPNLGKSNFLSLLNTVFNGYRFNENDFNEASKPIEVVLKLILDDIEKGVFEDLFDPTDGNSINVVAAQGTIDDNITFIHKETGSSIPVSAIKSLNYIHHDPLRDPQNEFRFDRKKGVARFLNHIFNKFMSMDPDREMDFVDRVEFEKLLSFINQNLKKIKPFQEFSISARVEQDTQDLIARVVTLRDENNISLQNSGYGIQFMTLVCLTIFEKLLFTNRYRLEKGVFLDEEGKRHIAVLLGLDEPEIHLHPYLQRSLIKYLLNIIANQDTDFLEVLSEIFAIDSLIGQIIVSTHSPNILLTDYRQITRFYRNDTGKIIVKNGHEISLEKDEEKHLLRNMPYIKEAFFSKCVILVEGDSELAALPELARKLLTNLDLDDYGISVVQGGGGGSIPIMMKMLSQFGINNVGILDKDSSRPEHSSIANLFCTDREDFEDEIISICLENGRDDILKGILVESEYRGLSYKIQKDKLNSIIKKYRVNRPEVTEDHDFNTRETDLLYPMYLAWFGSNKSIILGKTAADHLPTELIPPKYKQVIEKALEISRNV